MRNLDRINSSIFSKLKRLRYSGILFLICFIVGTSIYRDIDYRLNPNRVSWFGQPGTIFKIQRRKEGEWIVFDFVRDNAKSPDISLAGTTGSFCSDPYIIIYDMNKDGRKDIYFHHCGGHGFLQYSRKLDKLSYVNLGQPNGQAEKIAPGWKDPWLAKLRNTKGWFAFGEEIKLLAPSFCLASFGFLGCLGIVAREIWTITQQNRKK